MTVVYIDALFLLNLIVNYLLLLAAAKLAGEPLRRLRLAAGAALGGLYAAAIFFPGMGFLTHPLCKLGAAVLMLLCVVTFWFAAVLLQLAVLEEVPTPGAVETTAPD